MIKVTITGKQGEGKSTIAEVLHRALTEQCIGHEIYDAGERRDYPLRGVFEKKADVKVAIEVIQS